MKKVSAIIDKIIEQFPKEIVHDAVINTSPFLYKKICKELKRNVKTYKKIPVFYFNICPKFEIHLGPKLHL